MPAENCRRHSRGIGPLHKVCVARYHDRGANFSFRRTRQHANYDITRFQLGSSSSSDSRRLSEAVVNSRRSARVTRDVRRSAFSDSRRPPPAPAECRPSIGKSASAAGPHPELRSAVTAAIFFPETRIPPPRIARAESTSSECNIAVFEIFYPVFCKGGLPSREAAAETTLAYFPMVTGTSTLTVFGGRQSLLLQLW